MRLSDRFVVVELEIRLLASTTYIDIWLKHLNSSFSNSCDANVARRLVVIGVLTEAAGDKQSGLYLNVESEQ